MNKIIILSAKKSCNKVKKLIQKLEDFAAMNNLKAEIEIITEFEEFLKHETWILPTVIINGKIAARGYMPTKEFLFKYLKSEAAGVNKQ